MTKLEELAKERDAQLKVETSTEDWRDLFDRARCLFREAALPNNIARLLTKVFLVRKVPGGHCETILARVLSTSQKKGYEAAVQELESLGVPAPQPP